MFIYFHGRWTVLSLQFIKLIIFIFQIGNTMSEHFSSNELNEAKKIISCKSQSDVNTGMIAINFYFDMVHDRNWINLYPFASALVI